MFPVSVNPSGRSTGLRHAAHGTKLAAKGVYRRVLMERIEKAVEVRCPIHTVYNQWTQFEEFPKFMSGVKEVRQIDDTHQHWRAEIWGKEKEWDAELVEQVPDSHIAWRSTSGAPNNGAVHFEPMGVNTTRVRLTMEYEPEGMVENVGDAVGLFSKRVQTTVEQFKEFIEGRGSETGAWRGEVHGGQAGNIGTPPAGSKRTRTIR
jgi:uncharacterized membrane protein